ncbi:hypothetical protein ABZ502_30095 [Streptomyces abikoensis]|uniref:hypothetical protein n=1 Tax=Streptomyces abikoensis TaxID=97398 RepID=UPI0033CBBB71
MGNVANDVYQDRKLTEAGWTVLRFWESDLIHHLSACARRLREAIMERLDWPPAGGRCARASGDRTAPAAQAAGAIALLRRRARRGASTRSCCFLNFSEPVV